jgi:5-methylthioadenosine/S-adenosylhomocysteine deaminase
MPPRVQITADWVLGYDGAQHTLLRDACVVYEGDEILYVGHRFDGHVDESIQARGRLVCPGFINCHLHLGSNAPHTFFLDATRADYFGANFWAYAVGKRGYGDPRKNDRAEVEQLYGLWSAIRGGATTVVDVGTKHAPEVAALAGEIGARVYLGPAFKSKTYAYDTCGRINWDDDHGSGEAGLQRALSFASKFDGAHDGRVRAMLFPAQLDTCDLDLLRATRRAADEHGLPISIHAAMNLHEFHRILSEYGRTPLELLDSIAFLGPDVLLGHCVFHAHHSWTHYPYVNDLDLLAASGTAIAHAPYKYAKMGIALESLARYRARGITVALGTDTFPQDMIREMRYGSLMSRFADGSFRSAPPREVFDAATLGGAQALGRDDLGRLAAGARADLLLVDLRGLHYGAVHDPIRSLVEYGDGSDIERIVIAGRTLVADHQGLAVDEQKLLAEVRGAGEAAWARAPEWHWGGKSVEELAPLTYPLQSADTSR